MKEIRNQGTRDRDRKISEEGKVSYFPIETEIENLCPLARISDTLLIRNKFKSKLKNLFSALKFNMNFGQGISELKF